MKKILLLFTALIIWGCSSDEPELIQDHIVDKNEVNSIVQQLRFKSTSSNTTGRNSADLQKKDIKTIYEVPDESGETGFYIINFKKDGFIILSADDRLNPVRAFNNEGHFAIEGEIPAGLGGWLTAEQQYVSDIRNGKIKPKKHKWTIEKINELLNSDGTIDPDNPDGIIVGPDTGGGDDIGGCNNTYEVVMLNSGVEWGQGNPNVRGSTPYNANTPYMDCNRDRYVNGRAPVGCVAVAVG